MPAWTQIDPALHDGIVADVETKLLRRSLPGSAIYALIIGLSIVSTSLPDHFPRLLYGSLAALVLLTAARAFLTLRYAGSPWAGKLGLALVIASLSVYVIPMVVAYIHFGFASASLPLLFGLAGITSVAPTNFSPARRFAALYLSIGYIPLLLVLALHPSPGSPVILGILVFGYPTTLAVIYRMHRQFWVAIQDMVLARERADEREKAKRLADQANLAKSTSLARMTHELRTPLNGVLGIAGLLADAKLPAKETDQVKLIVHAGQSLLHIINEVLDFSRLEAGKLTLQLHPFDPAAILRDTVDLYQTRADEAGLHLHLQTHDPLPPALLGDGERLRQLLTNLLGNALKFTSSGQITVSAHPEIADDVCFLSLSVEDTGIGIAPDDLEHVFAPFEQADPTIAPRFGGTGLGLAIVRDLVKQMEGTITVASDPGTGTRFDLRLPFPITNAPRPLEPIATPPLLDLPSLDSPTLTNEAALDEDLSDNLPPDESSAPRWRILVAEDDRVSQRVARGLLERLACHVDIADNGHRAIALCTSNPYDLVLMDCNMPDIDGYEAARQIRQTLPDAPPIVAVTANTQPKDRHRALAAGMVDHLSKPIDRQTLATLVKRWIPAP
ncbi:MAG: response regulator [Deltaproteobacteria bacterium]|nr:response regulator [Deltaproteobacteria bacterium]